MTVLCMVMTMRLRSPVHLLTAVTVHNGVICMSTYMHFENLTRAVFKDALIHHLAYCLSVHQPVSCYIGISKLLTDIIDIS